MLSSPPLAEILRPQKIEDVKGQPHLLGPEGALYHLLNISPLPSLILWGPPGVGKTTLARLIAKRNGGNFTQLSAVFAGVSDLKNVFEKAQSKKNPDLFSSHSSSSSGRPVLFIDEIHRFNKAQQDALLGPLESGLITLIGATTENPSFSLNNALLSRLQVLTLKSLEFPDLEALLQEAEHYFKRPLPLNPLARKQLCMMAAGDGRAILNMAETLFNLPALPILTPETLSTYLQRRPIPHDKNGEYHYNLISAMIKAMRGSDPDGALYWMSRLLAAGEDPLFISRRLIRFAAEDVGLADPHALPHAVAAHTAYERLGSPEGELCLVNALLYLATAPKSNAAYMAFKKSLKKAKSTAHLPPPKHILNGVTPLLQAEGYGEGYLYDHDFPEGFSGQSFLPEGEEPKDYTFYIPVERGFEREIQKRLVYWEAHRRVKKDGIK